MSTASKDTRPPSTATPPKRGRHRAKRVTQPHLTLLVASMWSSWKVRR